MEFTVEFYQTESGHSPVQEFLDELKQSDPDDFAAIVAGLAKLRHRQYHREPLSKALGGGLLELRGGRLGGERSRKQKRGRLPAFLRLRIWFSPAPGSRR